MAEVLGDPQFDPHGAPIPSRSGTISRQSGGRLVDMQVGDRLTVVEVTSSNPELLRYLGDMGLYPGTDISIVSSAPFNGPLTLDIGDNRYSLGYDAAKSVLVALQR